MADSGNADSGKRRVEENAEGGEHVSEWRIQQLVNEVTKSKLFEEIEGEHPAVHKIKMRLVMAMAEKEMERAEKECKDLAALKKALDEAAKRARMPEVESDSDSESLFAFFQRLEREHGQTSGTKPTDEEIGFKTPQPTLPNPNCSTPLSNPTCDPIPYIPPPEPIEGVGEVDPELAQAGPSKKMGRGR